ncbi:MAG: hypothetical protein EAY75_07335 [Bacteroidetes bacterium]|nr:MAG: hypothetical protein EAY75_07335 [Bacteroidota bacterium]
MLGAVKPHAFAAWHLLLLTYVYSMGVHAFLLAYRQIETKRLLYAYAVFTAWHHSLHNQHKN